MSEPMTTQEQAIDPTLIKAFGGDKVWGLLDPLFRACRGDSATRYSLSLPFIMDGFVYSTDGAIAVRQAITEKDDQLLVPLIDLARKDLYAGQKLPPAGRIFDATKYEDWPTPLPEKIVAFHVCEACLGFGDCEECDDEGLIDNPETIELATNFSIAAKYAALLVRYGASIYLPVEIPADASKKGPAKFTIHEKGIEGRLMPLLR